MSLNYNLTKIKNHKDLCWRQTEELSSDGKPLFEIRAVTDRIIWGTMLVDVGDLKNITECELFYDRYCEANAAIGTALNLTMADVLAHKGLTTNVHKTTDAKWLKKLALMLRDRVERDRIWAARKAAKAAEAVIAESASA